MAALTLRSVKGSELTAAEIDANFTNLNTDKLSSTAAGYPAIRTSLNLDFANSQSVDPRITFARASTARKVNANGLIEVVASGSPRIDFDPVTQVCKGLLIEEQRTNLLTYSENFDNAAWQGTATAFPDDIASPDGTITADTLSGAVNTDKYQTVTSVSAGVQYTASIFVKAGTVNQLRLREPNSNIHADINLTLNTISVTSGAGTATLVNYGNNWFRATISYMQVGAIALVTLRNNSAITGDWHVWGAQLEEGSFPTSYIPSSDTFTSRASTTTYVGSNGLIQSALTDVARYNYNPVNLALAPKLLLESASTNLLTYSEQFDNAAWNKSNATITANAITAPNGTLTADKMVQNTANTTHLVKQGAITTNTNPLSATIYAKAGERTNLLLQLQENTSFARYVFCVFDLTTGTAGSVTNSGGASSSTASCTSVGNGWFRCSIISTLGGVDTNSQLVVFDGVSLATYTGDGTSGLYIWGAQLEASSFPTSYIPTVASQVTRAADISTSAQTTRVADTAGMTGTNFSSWYNQTEGTVLCKFDAPLIPANSTTYSRVYSISGGTYVNAAQLLVNGGFSPDRILFTSSSAGVTQSDFGNITGGYITAPVASATNATAYKVNDFASAWNGGVIATDTLGSVPVGVTKIDLGNYNSTSYLNGHISKLSYYPKCLTNSELQALTTG